MGIVIETFPHDTGFVAPGKILMFVLKIFLLFHNVKTYIII